MSSPNGLVACTMAVVLSVALASPRAAVAEKMDARRHYEKATAAFGLGKYDEAAREYEAAFELKPDPALLYNAAQAYRLAGRSARAIELYRNYLRLYGGEAVNAEDARQHIARLEAVPNTERLPPPPPAVSPVAVKPSTPLGAGAAGSGSSPGSAGSPTGGPIPPSAPEVALAPRLSPADPGSPPGPPALGLGAPARADTAPTAAAPQGLAESPPALMGRPAFWVVLAATVAVLAGGTALLLSRSGDQDPKATLGIVNAN
jgi:tetratricopeptide (TPR) repeat protein